MRMTVLEERVIQAVVSSLVSMAEKAKRLFLAKIAIGLGYGGIAALARAVHVSRGMISRGIKEVKNGEVYIVGDRNRRAGAGRPTIEQQHRRRMIALGLSASELEEAIDICKVVDKIVEKAAYGDPMTNKKWINTTVKSVAEEVYALTGQKYSHSSIKKIIRKADYSLQKNQKYDQVGSSHPKRNDQFEFIETKKVEYLAQKLPVISIDSKSKEKVGDFINSGREYRKTKNPRRVLDHDFAFKFKEIYPTGTDLVPPELFDSSAIVIPYGVYCLNDNSAHVSIGISHETSEFAADSIRNWWRTSGKKKYPKAKKMLILSDGGGSNRSRGWLWKIALQQLADDLGIEILMCHYPPGASKYDPIERRLWSQVSHTWAGKPLTNLEVINGYISHTRTSTGLEVSSEIISLNYLTEPQKKEAQRKGLRVHGITNSDLLKDKLCIEFIGDDVDLRRWNYIIAPHPIEDRWKEYGYSEAA